MSTQTIDRQDAQHVLWHFNGAAPKPGRFTEKLLEAYSSADPINRQRIALGFPSLASAFDLAANQMDGIAKLQEIANAE